MIWLISPANPAGLREECGHCGYQDCCTHDCFAINCFTRCWQYSTCIQGFCYHVPIFD